MIRSIRKHYNLRRLLAMHNPRFLTVVPLRLNSCRTQQRSLLECSILIHRKKRDQQLYPHIRADRTKPQLLYVMMWRFRCK